MTEKPSWDESVFKIEEVKQWISSCFEDKPKIDDEVEVFRKKKWGLTAAFTTDGERYVFKGSSINLFKTGALVDELLERHCPEHVGRLLRVAGWKNNIWMLYEAFEGEPLALNKSNLEDLLKVTADIQNKTAYAYDKLIFQLKHTTLTSIAHHVHRIQDYIQEAKVDPEIIRALWDYRSSIKTWLEILRFARIPHGLDHRDLGLHNAIRRKDGSLLIYDWEEAIISCPFFSLERFLADARQLDIQNKKIKADSTVPYSPMEEYMLEEYIKLMRWKHPKALTIAKTAIAVGHIKSTFENIVFRKKLELPVDNPFDNYPLVLSRWKEVKDLGLNADDFIPQV